MSTNASSISTVSSLPSVSLLSSCSPSPTSTRADAGWGLPRRDGRGSPDVDNLPTSPLTPLEPTSHSPINPAPILSVDVPLAAHRLREGMMDGHARDVLHSHLYAPHLHRAFEFHLEPNSPLWSLTRMYLQNQRLKTILDLASSLSSIGRRCNTLRTIQREVEEDLFSTFYQMQMPEFADDLERYVRELTTSTNPQPLPSASSSPISPETELTLQCVELRHEVDTTGTIHGIPVDAPLSRNHPRYHESCFQCHHLGHIHIHCWWYVCPICKVNRPGHPQCRCPLGRPRSRPSSSSSSSSSQPHPIPPPRSRQMVPENSRVHRRNPRSRSPPRSHSPLEDFDYDDVAIANMTGSPVSSYIDF